MSSSGVLSRWCRSAPCTVPWTQWRSAGTLTPVAKAPFTRLHAPRPNCPGRGSNRSRISICLSAQCQARGCPFCHRPALSDDVLTRSELLSRDATTESQVANVLRPQVEWSNTGSVTTPHTPREVSVTGGVENEETSGAYLFLLDLKLLGRAFLVGFFL